MLTAISPVDGRYASKAGELSAFFSEYALIKYRVRVEVEYLIMLSRKGLFDLPDGAITKLKALHTEFSLEDGQRVKDIESITNHDVKAVEYFIKEKLSDVLDANSLEFVHFGLTSQDINNTALPLMVKESLGSVMVPVLEEVAERIYRFGKELVQIPMLSRTHGQPASPTTLGKEILVFHERLCAQTSSLRETRLYAKFGGATGNLNAHVTAYPGISWRESIDAFISDLGLTRHKMTTQIAHYDDLAELFHTMTRANTILIDFCKDIWTYISLNYFSQHVIANEVGSSAMPHKVNPIDFENAEGNLGYANSILEFLARKLPVSRLQRDLTDSTVTRNIGVPFAHSLIAWKSILKGLSKLSVHEEAIKADLDGAWAVISEGIQTILRREGFEKPYELLKSFSRGKGALTKEDFDELIESLEVSPDVRRELRSLTPASYIGYAGSPDYS
jgi:adenylosuccinate lyase